MSWHPGFFVSPCLFLLPLPLPHLHSFRRNHLGLGESVGRPTSEVSRPMRAFRLVAHRHALTQAGREGASYLSLSTRECNCCGAVDELPWCDPDIGWCHSLLFSRPHCECDLSVGSARKGGEGWEEWGREPREKVNMPTSVAGTFLGPGFRAIFFFFFILPPSLSLFLSLLIAPRILHGLPSHGITT